MQLSPSAHVDSFCRESLPPASQWPELEFGLPGLRYPARLNCADELLDATIAAHGADRPCLLSPTETWSYGDLASRASQIARVLTEDLGLLPGNRVLLRGPNNPWLVACWFGVLKAGGVAVTTMSLLRSGELVTIGEIARVRLALCDHRHISDLDEAKIPGLRIVPFGGTGSDDLSAMAARKTWAAPSVQTAADDVAMIAFTSGTTGRPKATLHFHRDILAVADTFSAQVLKPRPDDLFTGTPPLAFTFGLGGLVIFPLRVGASTLLLERATPAELADQIAERRVSVCFTAPTAYRAMIAAGKGGQLRGLRRPVSAGEHLPASVWQAFHDETGVQIIDGIGSTELLHIFISAADGGIRPGATGRAVPGYRAAIIDDEGKPVPDGEPGRLAVRGPTGCRYLADDRQRSYVSDGWNLTGDTYLRDGDGYFWYQARSDDIIVSSGYNIAGPEIEEALLSHPDVAECGVVGVPDEARGQIVKAFVVLAARAAGERGAAGSAAAGSAAAGGAAAGSAAAGSAAAGGAAAGSAAAGGAAAGGAGGSEAAGSGAGGSGAAGEALVRELQDYVKQRIAPYKYPRQVEFVAELPRTNTGKLQRYRLRDGG